MLMCQLMHCAMYRDDLDADDEMDDLLAAGTFDGNAGECGGTVVFRTGPNGYSRRNIKQTVVADWTVDRFHDYKSPSFMV